MAENEKLPTPEPETTGSEQQDPAGSTFTPITSQKDLDDIIKNRLERERAKYAGFDELKAKAEQFDTKKTEYETRISDLTSQISTLQADIQTRDTAAAKSRIAKDFGLPEDFASRLNGSTEEEWKADAQSLAGYFRQQPVYPSVDHSEPADGDAADLLRISRLL